MCVIVHCPQFVLRQVSQCACVIHIDYISDGQEWPREAEAVVAYSTAPLFHLSALFFVTDQLSPVHLLLVAMSVFLLVRRKKTSIFLSANESDSILEVKRMVDGILKQPPSLQQLYYLREADDNAMSESSIQLDDSVTLSDSGITANNAKAQDPAVIGLAFADESGNFEPLDITPYSSPPPLPDVLKATSASDVADATRP